MPEFPPEDPTESMLDRGVRVAAATGLDIAPEQIHDIWQAMMDEWLADNA